VKLQLSSHQASRYATLLREKGVADAAAYSLTAQVLKVFAEEGHSPFTRRDVNATLLALPGKDQGWIDANDNDISTAVSHNDRGGDSRRGYYTLNLIKTPTPAPLPPTPAPPAPLAPIEVVVENVAGVAWTPPVVPSSPLEGYYAHDVGLRRLAISESRCYGSYVEGNDACDACPLASSCASLAPANLQNLAAAMDRATTRALEEAKNEALRVAAEIKRRAQAPASHPRSDAPPPAPKPAGPKAWPPNFKELDKSIPFDAVCSGCKGSIPKHSSVVHVSAAGVAPGMYHIDCARKLVP